MKKTLLALALLAATAAAQANETVTDTIPPTASKSSNTAVLAPDEELTRIKQMAIAGAAGDSLSTYIALQNGAVELNGLVNTGPMGLVALAAIKWGLVELFDASSMTPEYKKTSIKLMGSLWWGAVANNTLIALSASNPVSLAVGVATGLYVWNKDYKSSDLPKSPVPVSEANVVLLQ